MINAVILLNEDLDDVKECNTFDSCKTSNIHKGSSNLFFLLSVSIPRPMFPSNPIMSIP